MHEIMFIGNIERFPWDFIFELTDNEIDKLVLQNVITS